MAGDVYTQAPFVGRGGWSWYTGAAAWMHRAAVEAIFGLSVRANELTLTPCLPPHWNQAEISLKRDGHTLRFVLYRGSISTWLAANSSLKAQALAVGEPLRWADLLNGKSGATHCFVVQL